MTTPNDNAHVNHLIDAYIVGALDDADRQAVDAHIAGCAACAAALDAARKTDQQLSELFASARPAKDLEDRVIVGLRTESVKQSRRWMGPSRHPLVRRIAIGVAATVVLGGIGFGMQAGLNAVEQQAKAKEQAAENENEATPPDQRAGQSAHATSSPTSRPVEQSMRRRSQDHGVTLGETNFDSYSYGMTHSPGGVPNSGKNDNAEVERMVDEGRPQSSMHYLEKSSLSDGETLKKYHDTRDREAARAGKGVSVSGTSSPHDEKGQEIRAKVKAPANGELGDTLAWGDYVVQNPNSKNAPDFDLGVQQHVTWAAMTPTGQSGQGKAEKEVTLEQSAARRSGGIDANSPQGGGGFGGGSGGRGPGGGAGGGGAGVTNGGYLGNVPQQGSGNGQVAAVVDGISTHDGRVEWSKDLAANGKISGGKDSSGVSTLTTSGGTVALGTELRPHMTGVTAAPPVVGPNVTLSAGLNKTGNGTLTLQGVNTMGRDVDGKKSNSAVEFQLLEAPKVELGANFRPGEVFEESRGWKEGDKRKLTGKPADAADSFYAVPADGAYAAVPSLKPAASATPESAPKGAQLGGEHGAGPADPKSVTAAPSEPGAIPNAGAAVASADPAKTTPTPTTPTGETPENKPPQTEAPTGQPGKPDDGPKVKPAHVEQPERRPEQPIKAMIIRNGTLQFEVDSFDSALMQMNKIVAEEGGYLSGTSSDKLPNGKVRGVVVLRCPPERLDTLVLKLRGMGDLKSQRLTAEDVTKHYTDLNSQLRAAQTMEKRLLAIIEAGGLVKDLLEAEKQLGIWREKLEVLQGEMNYIKDQATWSTLTVELMERDVRTPTSAAEIETVNTSVETEDVEKSRAEALKAIQEVKGRIVDSDLKKHEGGQLSATIVADVAPDSAGQVIDRLKQLGKLARLDITRKTVTQGGVGPIIPGLKIERKETRLQISLYNLANISPRQMTTLNLAATDVEVAYKSIVEQVKASGGRVVSSQLNRPKADQTVGTIVFEAPSDKADVLLGAVRTGVEVMRMEVTQNADTQNSTDAKRGFSVQVYSLAHVPPRETTTLQIGAPNVSQSFNKVLDAAKGGGGRIITSQLSEQDPNNITGNLEFEVLREKWQGVATALQEAGIVVTRNVTRSQDTENTVDSKIRMSVTMIDDIRLAPRETVSARVATATVAEAFQTLATAAKDAGARVVGSNLNLNDRANPSGTLNFAIPRENAAKFEAVLKAAGVLVSRTVNRQPDGAMNVDTKIGFDVAVMDELQLAPRETVTAVVATRQVPETFNALANAARDAGARVVGSSLDVSRTRPQGDLSFSVPKENAEKFETAMKAGGLVINRTVTRQQDSPMVADGRTGFSIRVQDERTMQPREQHSMTVVNRSASDRYARMQETLRLLDAQVITTTEKKDKDRYIGVLDFVIRREDRDVVEKALFDQADVYGRTVERSQDTQNTVDHRVRFMVTLLDANQQPPRQIYELVALAADLDKVVSDTEGQAAVIGGTKIDSGKSVAGGVSRSIVVIDVPLAKAGEMVGLVRSLSAVTSTQVTRNDQALEGNLSRARIIVTYHDANKQNPRETIDMQVESGDITKAASDLETTATSLGGRKVSVTRSGPAGKETTKVVIDVPAGRRGEAMNAIRGFGTIRSTQSSQDEGVPDTNLARVRIQATFAPPVTVGAERGMADSLRLGLNSGLNLVSAAAGYLVTGVIGLVIVLVILTILWGILKLVRRMRGERKDEQRPPTDGGSGPTPSPMPATV